MTERVLRRSSWRGAAVLLLACLVSGSAQAADRFTIFLRNLDGTPVPRGQVQAFEQADDGIVTPPAASGGSATTTIQVGSTLLRVGPSMAPPWIADDDGKIVADLNALRPDRRTIVFLASRENVPVAVAPTAMIPFMVDAVDREKNGTLVDRVNDHTFYIAVPERVVPSAQMLPSPQVLPSAQSDYTSTQGPTAPPTTVEASEESATYTAAQVSPPARRRTLGGLWARLTRR